MGASCWIPLQGKRRQDLGQVGCHGMGVGEAEGCSVGARPVLCGVSLVLGQSLKLSDSLKLQKWDLAGEGLVFTVPTPEASESLQVPFVCREQLREGCGARAAPGS